MKKLNKKSAGLAALQIGTALFVQSIALGQIV